MLLVTKDTGGGGVLPYYVLNNHTLNTFSQEEVARCVKYGSVLVKTIDVKVEPIQEVIKREFNAIGLDFLSIDVEGQDYELLKAVDYTAIRPAIICIETQEYMGEKRENFNEMLDFMKSNDYMVYADTMLNTIFMDKRAW